MVFKFYRQNIREYRQQFQKNNEIRVTKIKKYAWSLLKSCFGDILDKNTAARKKIRMLILKYCLCHSNLQYCYVILSQDAKQFLKIPISNKVPQKAVLSI